MANWFRGLLPIGLLAVVLLILFRFGPLGVFQTAFPPLEELTIDRVVLPAPHQIVVHVTNGGPDTVTIAQVQVDEAFWNFRVEPSGTIPRLGTARIFLPYPWVQGEAHEIKLVTSTGLTFTSGVDVATESPQPNWSYFVSFSLLGIYAGVIPVFLGLLWYPFLRELSARWLLFFLSLTAGLLFFLAADSVEEALETAEKVPGAYQGVSLIVLGIVFTLLLLHYLSGRRPGNATAQPALQERARTALLIALGIGLHNLGEGLAIGSSYALGQISLGTFLVVGFTLHNLTEGLGIVTPVAKDNPSIARLAALGCLAGFPTVVGTWVGGFSYSATLGTLFLAVGAGAILQVLYQIGQLIAAEQDHFVTAHTAFGFLAGLGVMYVTGLLVLS